MLNQKVQLNICVAGINTLKPFVFNGIISMLCCNLHNLCCIKICRQRLQHSMFKGFQDKGFSGIKACFFWAKRTFWVKRFIWRHYNLETHKCSIIYSNSPDGLYYLFIFCVRTLSIDLFLILSHQRLLCKWQAYQQPGILSHKYRSRYKVQDQPAAAGR